MNLFKIKKHEMFLGISAAVLYLFTRLYNIMSLPMFTDEAIYTRWSQIARFDPSWRFISLTDGKQPLFVWIDMIFMRITSDPLLAGRLVSVFAGFLAMTGIYFLAKELFNKKVASIAAFLYILYPFSLVYDRMALYDSLVAAAAIWSLLVEILLVKYKRLDIALILGMVLGASILTKTSGFLFIYLLPFSLILFDFKDKKRKDKFLKWAGLSIIAVAFAYFYYSILRLSPFLYIINQKNATFVYPFFEWIKHPFYFFPNNFQAFLDWFFVYTTPPGLILIALSALGGRKKEKLLLFVWFIAPITALALFGNTLYPRFILFMTMPLIILGAYSLDNILSRVKKNTLKVFVILLFLGSNIYSDYFILNNFARAPIPNADLEQYINGWPAGGGIKEVITFLNSKSQGKKIYVASLGEFGSLPKYSIEIYLGENKNVEKRGIYPVPDIIPSDLLEKSKLMPVYVFISNQHEFEISSKNWPMKLILEYRKGIGDSYSRLYQVK